MASNQYAILEPPSANQAVFPPSAQTDCPRHSSVCAAPPRHPPVGSRAASGRGTWHQRPSSWAIWAIGTSPCSHRRTVCALNSRSYCCCFIGHLLCGQYTLNWVSTMSDQIQSDDDDLSLSPKRPSARRRRTTPFSLGWVTILGYGKMAEEIPGRSGHDDSFNRRQEARDSALSDHGLCLLTNHTARPGHLPVVNCLW
jgi:hypothetical protein